MQFKSMCAIFLIIAIPFIAYSQTIENNAGVADALNLIEKWIEAQAAYNQIPGVSMAIVYDQKVIWRFTHGYANPEQKIPTQTNTIYSICSISKLFTSIALLQLRDKGLLRLDDPVDKHLSWFNIQQAYPDSPPITIESLLIHASGLPRESDFPYWNAPAFDFPTRQKMMDQLKHQETIYPAYTYYQYSNLGLTLAGELVAAISGQDFKTYVTENIIKPMDLQDTRTAMPKDLHGQRLAIGYSAKTRDGMRERMPLFKTNAITPAAGFSSTAEDLTKFAIWQMRVLKGEQSKILQSNTLKEMQRVHWLDANWKTTRGLGFGVYRRDGTTFVGHEGSCPGYRTAIMLQPEDKVAIIFMTNTLGVDAGHYARAAYRLLIPALKAAQNTRPERSFDAELMKFTGTYSEFPWGGEVCIFPWEGTLAMTYFPDNEPPLDPTQLKHIEANRFYRVRDNGERGEEIEFIVDDQGQVTRIKQHSMYMDKIK